MWSKFNEQENESGGDGDDQPTTSRVSAARVSNTSRGAMVKCSYCIRSMPFERISNHVWHEHEKCKYCGQRMPHNAMQKHLKKIHVKCSYCPKMMASSEIVDHMRSMHKNITKPSSMQALSQQKHIGQKSENDCDGNSLEQNNSQRESMHFGRCKHCGESVLGSNLNSHIEAKHPINALIGMIKLSKISDERFNQLMNEKRIFVKDGNLFFN